MALNIENRIREVPHVGVPPYRQVHAHSTGNPNSTAQNEADYYSRKEPTLGTFSHVVGNGRIIQVSPTGHGFWDVGGGWNYESYAAVELIESHTSKEAFMVDYKLYVELLRQLAKEAGLPTTLDTGSTGILTHSYCTYHQPNNNSDHVDPYPYLAKWGISKNQFARDLQNGFKPTEQLITEEIEEEGENDMLLITNKERKAPMLLLKGSKICGIPEDKGNVKAFESAGAVSIAVTDKMYKYLKETYK